MSKPVLVFDTEIIGKEKPVFLVCAKNIETGQTYSFWHDKKKDREAFTDMILSDQYTWISFNGIKFDAPLIAMWLWGHDVHSIKAMCTRIIETRMMPWDVYKLAGIKELDFDHIDLIEVAPGVMTSLKVYAGRMGYPTMVDLPFHHDQDLSAKERKVLEQYCLNDLGVTEALYKQLLSEIALRVELSEEHGMDLRSKSDAQVAEGILKKIVGVNKRTQPIPFTVSYKTPSIVKTRSKPLLGLVEQLDSHAFDIDNKTGSPVLPIWLEKTPFEIKDGRYGVGIGGLHSQHDKKICHVEDNEYEISDFDAASYYPKIILTCDLVPVMSAGKGSMFIAEYRDIYDRRLAAKRAGDKKTANSLKISLNGTYGKLGSLYSPFYSPDLMLAVCLTGQLNLLCLIDGVEKIKGASVISANTDGITVRYLRSDRDAVLKVFADNSKRTGFEYEEVKYRKIAFKDVNNYIAITVDGKVKAKGLYAETGLQKNPTMLVCSKAAIQFMLDGTAPETFITTHKDFKDFVSVRSVKGGGEQKGVPFGRVARWYMSTDPEFKTWPLQYSSNGNQVPKTEGARVCMTLPDKFPDDLDYDWYVNEAKEILTAIGITPYA